MGSYDDLEHLRRLWVQKLFSGGIPESQEFWDETGRVVAAYIDIRLGCGRNMNRVDPHGFADWLDHHAKTGRYASGTDIDRAELVDEWLLEHGVK